MGMGAGESTTAEVDQGAQLSMERAATPPLPESAAVQSSVPIPHASAKTAAAEALCQAALKTASSESRDSEAATAVPGDLTNTLLNSSPTVLASPSECALSGCSSSCARAEEDALSAKRRSKEARTSSRSNSSPPTSQHDSASSEIRPVSRGRERPVLQMNLETHATSRHKSLSAAAAAAGTSPSNLCNALKKPDGCLLNGSRWQYADEEGANGRARRVNTNVPVLNVQLGKRGRGTEEASKGVANGKNAEKKAAQTRQDAKSAAAGKGAAIAGGNHALATMPDQEASSPGSGPATPRKQPSPINEPNDKSSPGTPASSKGSKVVGKRQQDELQLSDIDDDSWSPEGSVVFGEDSSSCKRSKRPSNSNGADKCAGSPNSQEVLACERPCVIAC